MTVSDVDVWATDEFGIPSPSGGKYTVVFSLHGPDVPIGSNLIPYAHETATGCTPTQGLMVDTAGSIYRWVPFGYFVEAQISGTFAGYLGTESELMAVELTFSAPLPARE